MSRCLNCGHDTPHTGVHDTLDSSIYLDICGYDCVKGCTFAEKEAAEEAVRMLTLAKQQTTTTKAGEAMVYPIFVVIAAFTEENQ